MNFVSFLIVSVSTFTISFSVEATQSTQPYSRLPAHRKLQANESYIFQRLRTPFSFLQITRILEITTFFENSKLQAEYTYVEDLSDGRGFTAGRVGFCTGTGDLAEVVESYCLVQPKIQLCRFLPRLREISAVAEAQHQPNPDVRGLDQFSKAWTSASNDKKFQQQQDHALMEMYLKLGTFPEVLGVLNRLKSAGMKTAILSNGTPQMLKAAVDHAGIADLFDAVLSVEEVGVFKTDPKVYQLAIDRLGTEATAISFQSSNAWDAYAASAFGMRVVWCNRYGQRRERLPGKPDREVHTLEVLPEILGL